MPRTSDFELAQRVVAGERAAFDTLYERFYAPMLAWPAGRLGAGSRARTVTEASFRELLDALPNLDGDADLTTIALATVTRRVCEAAAVIAAPPNRQPATPDLRDPV